MVVIRFTLAQIEVCLNKFEIKIFIKLIISGREFQGAMKEYLKSLKIKHFHPSDDTFKCGMVERVNRTLLSLIHKFLTSRLTMRYIENLQDIVNLYNSRYHRSIGCAPSSVNDSNILKVWRFSRKNQLKRDKKFMFNQRRINFKKDDTVRVAKNKQIFSKFYTPNFTDEIFSIKKIVKRPQSLFKIHDYQNKPIEGIFYPQQLTHAIADNETYYRIEKIIERRKINGQIMCKVRWQGYDKTHDSWIPIASVVSTYNDG